MIKKKVLIFTPHKFIFKKKKTQYLPLSKLAAAETAKRAKK
jgi:hypothetical protein